MGQLLPDDFDLNNLDFAELPNWPMAIKMVFIGFVAVVALGLGYWFDTVAQQDKLAKVVKKQGELKTEFETKQAIAANLPAYRAHKAQIEGMLNMVLKILPEETEVPALVEDISTKGTAAGLVLRSIRLKPELQKHFYIELPMEINVIGNYHDIGSFLSDIASMSRLVTMHDFTIEVVNSFERQGLPNGRQPGLLRLIMTAKTYRYDPEGDS